MADKLRIEINIYRAQGVWYGAIWIDGEYDSSDALDCAEDADESEARRAALDMPLLRDGDRSVRIADEPSAPGTKQKELLQ